MLHLHRTTAIVVATAFLGGTASPLLASDEPTRTDATSPSVERLESNALPAEGIVTPVQSASPAAADVTASGLAVVENQDDPQPLHAGAVEYSDAYQLRRKIHKIASFATLPLLATELALGQSMYNSAPSDASNKRGLHAAVGVGIIGLFVVNTVTGSWNLFGEGWHDPHGRTLRVVHGLLMMVADAGFVATAATGPNSHSLRQAASYETNKVTHRNIAVASISVASASYLLMLFGNH
jgi:hypothetical protein